MRCKHEAKIRRLASKLFTDVFADRLDRGIEIGFDRMTGGIGHDVTLRISE